MKKKKIFRILGVILLIFAIGIIANKRGSNYEDLDELDKKLVDELVTYKKETEKKDVRKDYGLAKKNILAIRGKGRAYLYLPKGEISNLFAQKISLPADEDINIYRVSPTYPGLFKFLLEGNLPTIGKTYNLFGRDLYFTKYDEASFKAVNASGHYLGYLNHEALHYYIQKDRPAGERFEGDLSKEGMDLLEEEYKVLEEIRVELASKDPSKEKLEEARKTYLEIMDKRLAENPDYLKKELEMETVEGTASFVQIKADDLVGYDYGVLYFDNVAGLPFTEVIPTIKKGQVEESFLRDRMPYESGALLCQLLEAIDVEDRQGRLNAQTKENPLSLYDLIKEL